MVYQTVRESLIFLKEVCSICSISIFVQIRDPRTKTGRSQIKVLGPRPGPKNSWIPGLVFERFDDRVLFSFLQLPTGSQMIRSEIFFYKKVTFLITFIVRYLESLMHFQLSSVTIQPGIQRPVRHSFVGLYERTVGAKVPAMVLGTLIAIIFNNFMTKNFMFEIK